VRLITTFVLSLNPQTLYQNVSDSVAVVESNFAARIAAFVADAGVKMNILAARPKGKVEGSSCMGVTGYAAAIDLISGKWVTREVRRKPRNEL